MRLLFVCTGNICRSPTADAVARSRLSAMRLDWQVDSAGTGGWHAGEAPDERAAMAGAARGYDFSGLSAREVEPQDFARFDHIIAMDGGHVRALQAMPGARSGTRSGTRSGARISLMMDWAGETGVDVPDPYYGGEDGFDRVLDMIERSVDGLIEQLSGDQSSG